VGQRFLQLLEHHPQFSVTSLAASDRSQGKPYAAAFAWPLPGAVPDAVRGLVVQAPEPPPDGDLVSSWLRSASAGPEAKRFARAVAAAAANARAISGAGSPGGAALDITANVVPFIAEEEEKTERETRKILGSLETGRVTPAPFVVSAQCHRVNVVDGHMAAVRVKLGRAADPAELRDAFASFTALPQELRLPTAPERPILVRDEPDRPQPRLDRDAGRGMSVTVGRIARDAVLGHRFVALSHNTIRGAAGAAVLNAELLLANGYLGR